MPARQSPYTVLGLRPGADQVAVEQAYRRLIKQHHPDISSEDPERAAEINWAYAALKNLEQAPAALPHVPLAKKTNRRSRRLRGQAAGLLMTMMALGVLYLVPPRTAQVASPMQPSGASLTLRGQGPDTLDLRSLPDEDAIVSGVAAARRLHQGGLEDEAARLSRSCEDDLRTYPSPSLLDHCIAFDTASGLFAGRSANGRFRAEDMAARHVRSALRVSDDVVLAQERVDQVRRAAEKRAVQTETAR